MILGKYYLIRHPSKKEDPIHGQKQEHIHFKIHLDKQKTLTSYVLPSKELNPSKKTYLIYLGKYEASSALSSGKIIKMGKLEKIGLNEYKIDHKFIIKLIPLPKKDNKKHTICLVSYKKLN